MTLMSAQVISRVVEPIPQHMRALVLHGKEDLRFEERQVPSVGHSDVLVKIGSVGICGSDKHFYREGRASSDVLTRPFVLGHEFGGQIPTCQGWVRPVANSKSAV